MTNIIETKVIQPQAAMSIRVITTPAEIGQTLGQILGEVWTYLQGQGIQPAGPPFRGITSTGQIMSTWKRDYLFPAL